MEIQRKIISINARLAEGAIPKKITDHKEIEEQLNCEQYYQKSFFVFLVSFAKARNHR
jgi:hypothetical protein